MIFFESTTDSFVRYDNGTIEGTRGVSQMLLVIMRKSNLTLTAMSEQLEVILDMEFSSTKIENSIL